MDNEYDIYQDRIQMQKKYKKWDAKKAQDFVMGYFPDGTPDMKGPNDMKKVNWKEIADNWNEE